jgi:hypothetical protein
MATAGYAFAVISITSGCSPFLMLSTREKVGRSFF